MRRIGMWTAALLVGGSFVASCSGGIDGPVVEGNWRSGGEDAQIVGEVVFESECLYLYHSETDTRYPVIWPNGTEWDSDRSAVVLPDGTLVSQGVEISGGGGYHHSEDLSEYTTSEGVAVVTSCVDNEFSEVAVFNSSGDVEILR